jgi:hypothetical protein
VTRRYTLFPRQTHPTLVDDTQEVADPALSKPRKGRFGPLFGTTVHHAIGLILRDSTLTPEEAAHRAARRFGLQDHLPQCIADVTRALESLRTEGLAHSQWRTVRCGLREPIPLDPNEADKLRVVAELVAVLG